MTPEAADARPVVIVDVDGVVDGDAPARELALGDRQEVRSDIVGSLSALLGASCGSVALYGAPDASPQSCVDDTDCEKVGAWNGTAWYCNKSTG